MIKVDMRLTHNEWNMRKKTKFEKGLLALFLAPEIVFIIAVLVSGVIYLFLN